MADQPPPRRTLGDASNIVGPMNFNNIALPADNATNMVMNPALIKLVQSNQFHEMLNENPYDQLTTFSEIWNTVKINGVSDDRVRLNLFPFSLGGNAKAWLHSFEEGLHTQSKMMLDASAGGNINTKTEDEAYELIERMAMSKVVHSERGAQKGGLLYLLANDAMAGQNHLLTQKLDKLTKILAEFPIGVRNVSQTQQLCNLCGGDHINGQCAFPEELQQDVNYIGAQFQYKQGAFNQGSSSQGWKNHPSVGKNQNNSSGPIGGFRQQQPSPLWQQVSNLTKTVRDLSHRFDKFFKVYECHLNSNQASFISSESQIGQLSKTIETTEKNQFRANNDVNSKDECKDILTSHKRKAEGEPTDFENNEKGKEEMMSANEVNEKGSSEDEIELTDEEEDLEEDVIEPKKEGVEFTEEEEEFVVQPQKMKHPPKVEDPGCSTISCVLNECDVGEAMIDSGASINILPKYFLTKFRGLVLKPSSVIVTIADGSMAKPIGMVEDVIV
ncbi:uncharacterized protein LOC106779223 [Vigna radiata var. radiata]|uniref:Uncharacterized protein LOC106779223 n=1 Tax=Vigna radiata var. radiata TaxID=3916 RepID=A0A1S3VXJ9_VIGRR|nr:uncharacterized protein LOC106779223 [Vigna radiata var. radiata]